MGFGFSSSKTDSRLRANNIRKRMNQITNDDDDDDEDRQTTVKDSSTQGVVVVDTPAIQKVGTKVPHTHTPPCIIILILRYSRHAPPPMGVGARTS